MKTVSKVVDLLNQWGYQVSGEDLEIIMGEVSNWELFTDLSLEERLQHIMDDESVYDYLE